MPQDPLLTEAAPLPASYFIELLHVTQNPDTRHDCIVSLGNIFRKQARTQPNDVRAWLADLTLFVLEIYSDADNLRFDRCKPVARIMEALHDVTESVHEILAESELKPA